MKTKPLLVLLHGWGTNAHIWDGIIPALEENFELQLLALPEYRLSQTANINIQELASALASQVRRPAYWLGWSLGAILVIQIALSVPEKVQALFLVSATPAFRQADDWLAAMPQIDFDRFYSDFSNDPDRAVNRFMALQTRGDENAQSVMRQLKATLAYGRRQHLESIGWGLDLLRMTDLRRQVSNICQPVHLLHGAEDQIIPAEAGRYLAQTLDADINIWEKTGHAPFLSQPARFIAWMQQVAR